MVGAVGEQGCGSSTLVLGFRVQVHGLTRFRAGVDRVLTEFLALSNCIYPGLRVWG